MSGGSPYGGTHMAKRPGEESWVVASLSQSDDTRGWWKVGEVSGDGTAPWEA